MEGVYTGDLLSNLVGGRERGTDYLGDASLVLTLDGAALGWRGGTAFLYLLGDHGGKPSTRIGDLQTVDNIQAPSTGKVYEAWIQQNLLQQRASILFGLYDLNSELDVIESAASFLNSSFGIGPDYSQSGRNGPSIFPTTSLGLRISSRPAPALSMRLAILDGVAGDPGDPYGTHISLSRRDGLLIAWEIDGFSGVRGFVEPSRRRIGRGRAPLPYRGKLAVGGWSYTARFDDVLARDEAGRPLQRAGNYGIYALAEYHVRRERESTEQGLWIFGRAGLADPTVNRLVAYTGAGATYRGPFRGRDEDVIGLGVASAHNGERFETAQARAGRPVEESETTIELTYRAPLLDWFTLQGDVQYVIDPGTDPRLSNALVLGLRFELSN